MRKKCRGGVVWEREVQRKKELRVEMAFTPFRAEDTLPPAISQPPRHFFRRCRFRHFIFSFSPPAAIVLAFAIFAITLRYAAFSRFIRWHDEAFFRYWYAIFIATPAFRYWRYAMPPFHFITFSFSRLSPPFSFRAIFITPLLLSLYWFIHIDVSLLAIRFAITVIDRYCAILSLCAIISIQLSFSLFALADTLRQPLIRHFIFIIAFIFHFAFMPLSLHCHFTLITLFLSAFTL